MSGKTEDGNKDAGRDEDGSQTVPRTPSKRAGVQGVGDAKSDHAKLDRDGRLAAQLRANLKKRKALARARGAGEQSDGTE